MNNFLFIKLGDTEYSIDNYYTSKQLIRSYDRMSLSASFIEKDNYVEIVKSLKTEDLTKIEIVLKSEGGLTLSTTTFDNYSILYSINDIEDANTFDGTVYSRKLDVIFGQLFDQEIMPK